MLNQLLVDHTPLHKNLLTSSRLGCGQLVNLRDRDDFSTTDKSPAPNVSAVQRFHCISLVCPNLEYASQVWSPYKVGEITCIEGVQRFALHMCTKHWDASYQELLQLFSLPNLQQRRIYLDLCSMFRIVHGLFYFPGGVFCYHNAQRVTRSLNPYSFVYPFVRTCYYYNSYVLRTIRLWNSLPISLTSNTFISSVSSLNTNIRAHIYHYHVLLLSVSFVFSLSMQEIIL